MRYLARALLALLLLLPPLIWRQDYLLHVAAYSTGHALSIVIRQQWHVALAMVLLFLAFLVPLTWRRKAKWTEYGLVGAFFVSLFIEMFGVPLTLLFASRFLPQPDLDLPPNAVNLPILDMGLSWPMLHGGVVTGVGLAIIAVGWFQLYRAVKSQTVVTTGVYAFSRHPQYVGFILVLLGWVIGWPTLLTLGMAPLLVWQYVRVCRKEEADLDPSLYADYRARVPMLL